MCTNYYISHLYSLQNSPGIISQFTKITLGSIQGGYLKTKIRYLIIASHDDSSPLL